ncbi:hypothetical protein [Nonomuraea sp. NPDC049709]|uniref:hypothetical protein n=1 Tax=Nonomuraea sp. NPDC049709 TaxID=3154736 RepID=UPI003435A1E6
MDHGTPQQQGVLMVLLASTSSFVRISEPVYGLWTGTALAGSRARPPNVSGSGWNG